MIQLDAPYALPVVTTLLPNPDNGDEEAVDPSVNFRRTMNGTRYSYVKSSEARRLTYNFSNVGRGKLIEMQEFYKAHAADEIRLTDFRGDIWRVRFVESEVSFSTERRSFDAGSVRKESGDFTLTFVGEKITPLSLETPEFWLDASDADSFSLSGSLVDTWSDKGTSGVNVSQTGSARPTLVQNVANGLPGVRFDDSLNQYLFATAAPITGYPFTIFTVAQLITPEATGSGTLWRFSQGINQFLHGVYCYDNGSGNNFYIISDTTINNTVTSGLNAAMLNKPGVSSITEDGTTRTNRAYGEAGFSEVEGGWTPNTFGRTQIGFSGSLYYNGYIFEIRVYDRVLTNQERVNEEIALANKWGI